MVDLKSFEEGWLDADEAIRNNQSTDYSQGETDWDEGWNARLVREDQNLKPKRILSRQERLEAAADAGLDTWEDYRGER